MRVHFSWVLCLLLAIGTLEGQEPAAAPLCGIAIRVTDLYGRFVPHRVKSFLKDGRSAFHGAFRGLEAQVPCGIYSYEVERSDVSSEHGVLRGKVELDHWQHSLWLQTDPNLIVTKEGALALASLFDVPFDQKGQLEGAPERDDLWLSLLGTTDWGLQTSNGWTRG